MGVGAVDISTIDNNFFPCRIAELPFDACVIRRKGIGRERQRAGNMAPIIVEARTRIEEQHTPSLKELLELGERDLGDLFVGPE